MGQEKMEQFILGIDLGANSIGWALIKCLVSENEERIKSFGIERAGVRIFEAGVEGELEQGREESRAKTRREKRSIRRQIDRRARRITRLFNILVNAGLLPVPQNPSTQLNLAYRQKSAFIRHKTINDLDKELIEKWKKKLEEENAAKLEIYLLPKRFPYLLRARALDEKLTPYELGRAIYHLGHRRGFLSNRKSEDEKELGKVKSEILQLEGEIENINARTLGEYFSKINPEEKRIRGRYTSRQSYEDEFEKIWEAQKKYYPELLTDELKKEIYHCIFYQRPLKIQSNKIGECEYEKGRKRAPWAILSAQRFRLLQRVNDLKIYTPEGEELDLTPEQREKLIQALEMEGDLTFARIRKILGLSKAHKFNLERGGENRLPGNRTQAKLIKIFGKERWEKFTEQEKNQIVEDLLTIQNYKALKRRAVEVWGLDPESAEKFCETILEDGYCHLSRRAISKLLPYLEQGKPYMSAVKEVYPERTPEEKYEYLPPVKEVMPNITNPAVMRALTELRKVVNAIIREYGKPDMIRIELLRELKINRKARENIWKENRQQEKERKKAVEEILKKTNIKSPSGQDIEKYLLAEECGWRCPYTGRSFSWAELFGDPPQLDIEHIIPFSRCLDNSFANKTLCYAEENRNVKHNRTPWEAYGHNPERWQEIIKRVKTFKGKFAQEKLRRFQLKDEELEKFLDNFTHSQFNDTAYASRTAKQYLGLLYGADANKKVQASKGRITSYLRGLWGLNRILGEDGEKTRTDHRHHAIDAIVIALTEPSMVKKLSNASKKALPGKSWIFAGVNFPPPWENFYQEVKQAIQTIVVYYSPSREAPDGKFYHYVRKPLDEFASAKDLNQFEKKIQQIVDPAVREAVRKKVFEDLEGDFKKLNDRENHPYLEGKDGRKIPVHKVRIKVPIDKKSLAIIQSPIQNRYVITGSNHHIEIFEYKDKKGNLRWDGEVVSTFEAMRRKRMGEPIIKRDYGEGKRFVFSLAINESVLMKDENGKEQLYRVQKISQNKQIFFIKNTDARPAKDIPPKGRSRTPESLRKSLAKKVLITPLGDVRWAND